MSEIKLFVCCHRYELVPMHELLVPVQVGAALADEHFEGFFYDDSGEHISEKNRSYCELTAQYWAWKNVAADFYGFCHYRRYLYPHLKARSPYRLAAAPDRLEQLGFKDFGELIEQYDLIAPIGENMHISVREHYANAQHHYKKDLDTIECIIAEKYPGMITAMEQYLSGMVCYFGNIYIMRREVFFDYCGWLFSILEEFDRRSDTEGYGAQEKRVNGYLAERLFGIYYTWRRGELKTLELPRLHFIPNHTERWKKTLANLLLPPGSKRRAAVKKLRSR